MSEVTMADPTPVAETKYTFCPYTRSIMVSISESGEVKHECAITSLAIKHILITWLLGAAKQEMYKGEIAHKVSVSLAELCDKLRIPVPVADDLIGR